jgi:hypothetical protein
MKRYSFEITLTEYSSQNILALIIIAVYILDRIIFIAKYSCHPPPKTTPRLDESGEPCGRSIHRVHSSASPLSSSINLTPQLHAQVRDNGISTFAPASGGFEAAASS